MDAPAYLAQLQALLPPGAAWPRDPDAVLTGTLRALADEFARVDARAWVLLTEADPRATAELLDEWETAYGLPDPCDATADTYAERIAALVARVTAQGGASPDYFIGLGAALGYTVTIEEHDPHTVAHPVNHPIQGPAWGYAWTVHAPTDTVVYHHVTGPVSDPLADWGNDRLECVITARAPAHTHVLFAYDL